MSYSKPSTNPLKDAAGNETASFTDFPVENLLAPNAPDAPVNLGAYTSVAAGTILLLWDTPWHNGSPIEKYQVRHAAGTSVSSDTWTDIDGRGAGRSPARHSCTSPSPTPTAR